MCIDFNYHGFIVDEFIISFVRKRELYKID